MTTNLLPEHLNDLRKNGLSDEMIEPMGVHRAYRWKIPSQEVQKALRLERFDLVTWLELQARPAILGAGK
jgi:hypothetical protein